MRHSRHPFLAQCATACLCMALIPSLINVAGASELLSVQEKARKGEASESEFLELATQMRSSGAEPQAIAILRKAIEKYPSNTEFYRQLGIALVEADKPIEAVEVFDMLAAMEPDNAMAYNGKAVAFDTAGNHTAALEIYEKALSLSPYSPAIKNNMAMSMILNDQLDDAIHMLEALYEEAPDTPKVRHNLALAHGLKGNHKRAQELNKNGLTEEQAEQNLEFYRRYLSMKDGHKPVDLLTQDGQPLDDLFTELAEDQPEVVDEQMAVIPDSPSGDLPIITEASPSAGE